MLQAEELVLFQVSTHAVPGGMVRASWSFALRVTVGAEVDELRVVEQVLDPAELETVKVCVPGILVPKLV